MEVPSKRVIQSSAAGAASGSVIAVVSGAGSALQAKRPRARNKSKTFCMMVWVTSIIWARTRVQSPLRSKED